MIVLQGDPDPDYNTKKNDIEREKTSSSSASETRAGGDYAADLRLVLIIGRSIAVYLNKIHLKYSEVVNIMSYLYLTFLIDMTNNSHNNRMKQPTLPTPKGKTWCS